MLDFLLLLVLQDNFLNKNDFLWPHMKFKLQLDGLREIWAFFCPKSVNLILCIFNFHTLSNSVGAGLKGLVFKR